MDQARFCCDYGVIPTEFLNLSTVTNATELLWSRELERLLRLCGATEREIDVRASDYERFAALCKAFPLLNGHPMQVYLNAFLKAHFPSLPMPSPKTCDLLWQGIAEDLLAFPRAPWAFLTPTPMSCLVTDLEVSDLPSHLMPMPDANLFLTRHVRTYREWRALIEETLRQFCQKGARAVRLRLEHSFVFAQPDLYHVEKALEKPVGEIEKNLLMGQLFRELCEMCTTLSMELLLEADCRNGEAVALLQYAQKCVELPCISWCAVGDTARALIAFQADACGASMRQCLRTADALTDEALHQAIAEAASRYPLGRLCFVTAQDLRYSFAEQERITAALQKSF